MNATQRNLCHSLRIIWAIAAKDVVDAIKNKVTVSVILGVALLMLSSQALPLITRLSAVRRVVIYDAGASRLPGQLKRSPEVGLIRASSLQDLKDILVESSGRMLGLMLPADFDRAIDAGQALQLDGYFAHWVSASDAAVEGAFFETQLAALAGQPVRIDLADHAVYPEPDSTGQPLLVSISLVVVIITISGVLVPYLMVEEKETRTMDALLVSPARISQVVVGKAIAGMVYGLVAAAVVFAFNRALVVHWEWAVLATLCGTLFAVSAGLLLGSVFDNPQNMGPWMGLLFALLLMPVFLIMLKPGLPAFLNTVMPWIPSAALEKLFRISFSGGVSLDQALSNLGILVGSALLLLSAVVWFVRRSDR
jgi:ABC-2 type transport system permease protein